MNKLKLILKRLLGLIPTPTPIGATAFDLWASNVLNTYGIPDLPSYRQALCQMILQNKRFIVSKFAFALQLRKAQSNETAYQIMKDLQEQNKLEQQNAQKEKTKGSTGSEKSVVQQA